MFRVAITNHKGGSGKTTTAVNLAAALAERGRKVLLVDLDTHASASHWLGLSSSGRELLDTLLDTRSLGPLVQSTDCGIDVIPCGPGFGGLDRFALEAPGGEMLLRNALRTLDGRWDHTILDCPPNLQLATVNALAASNVALVPVTAHVLTVESLGPLVQTLIRVRDRLNPEFHLSGLLPSRVDRRGNHCKSIVGLLRERFGDNVYATEINESVRLAESPADHQPITLHEPRGRAAKSFRDLADELQRREEQWIERNLEAARTPVVPHSM